MTTQEAVILFQPTNGAAITSENYADVANRIMCTYMKEYARNSRRGGKLTTSKLRKIYGQIMNVYTKLNEASDFERHHSDLQYLKVKMAYEAGREKVVKEFLDESFLMEALDEVRRYEQFLLYCHYAESLVAYFKFYGGEDK